MNLRNITWNLIGLGLPALIAAITIPSIISAIGLERFGLLTIAWGLIAQAGIFDLGIGRATTQCVAKLLGQENYSKIPPVIATALALTTVVGSIAGGVFAIAIAFGIQNLVKTSSELAGELKWAALLLAVVLPIQAVSATYRGINEAYADFKGISLVRVFLGTVNFLGPFLISFFTVNLLFIVSSLLFSRVIGVVLYVSLAKKHVHSNIANGNFAFKSNVRPSLKSTIGGELIRFGGWFTAGSAASFLLNQSEIIAIGIFISAASISAFSIPFQVVIQCLVIVTAVSTIAFPQLSRIVQTRPNEAQKNFGSWLVKTVCVMCPICITMTIFLPSVLKLWVGEILPNESSFLGQILCVGVFSKTINILCFSMIHAYGRADLTTKVRILEVLVYLPVLCLLVFNFGVYGAAIGWVLRSTIDSICLFWIVRRLSIPYQLPGSSKTTRRTSNRCQPI